MIGDQMREHSAVHLSDQDLTLLLDGELAAARASAMQGHLSHCWQCRTRRAQLEQAIAGYVQLHQRTIAAESLGAPSAAGPAALLRANMAAAVSPGRSNAFALRWAAPALLSALAVGVAVLGLTWLAGQRATAAAVLPDARLTPGATRLISRDEVCGLAPQDEGRLIPSELATRVFRQYQISQPKPRAYEVDYLISPALGGANDIRNLWPLPYAEGVWTSRVKDALEDHLRRQVCAGRIDLATAQQEIASNWVSAYQKYFGTRRPLAAHTLFVKDSPWE